MKREKTRQKNIRLPESLLDELEKVSEQVPETQTDIMISGTRARLRLIKRRIEQRQQAEAVTA